MSSTGALHVETFGLIRPFASRLSTYFFTSANSYFPIQYGALETEVCPDISSIKNSRALICGTLHSSERHLQTLRLLEWASS